MDSERLVTLSSLTFILLLLALMSGFFSRPQFELQWSGEDESFAAAATDPEAHARQYRIKELEERFEQAVAMLHAKQYEFAITALDRVIKLSPQMPEAHVNMGFAMLGLEHYEAARRFFFTAIDLKPYQANAYWGVAVSSEKLEELDIALGAMRSYIHLSPPNDPFLRRARSALWEWETTLKRGPRPEAEREWIERRGKEWMDRSGPEADLPIIDKQEIVPSKVH